MEKISVAISKVVIILIGIYRYLLSPLLGNCCRFYPSCSTYSIEAIQQHKFLYGFLLTIKRLLRCHPFASGGYDPVPPVTRRKHAHHID
ncbi:MAG: membrane protein insertion efficiency factor YidD [Gammaproteobacteria bacterium]|nr:membrane protein insertion efficiency factor YidD [Gammaproteobacteria bacterium]